MILDQIASGINGLVTIATHAPGQAWRIYQQLPPEDKQALLERAGLGDTVSQNYYYENPQLFKMPASSPRGMGEFKEGSLTKALPYIAGGIALVVAYNMFLRK